MGAAAVTGLIWRSTGTLFSVYLAVLSIDDSLSFQNSAGVKSMAITSGLLTVGAAGWSWVKVQLL